MPTISTKTCVLCGVDCTDRPRTKDTKGRYFCKPCFEQALEKKKAGERVAIPAGVASGSRTALDGFGDDVRADFGLAGDSPLLDPAFSGSSSSVSAPPIVNACPTCHALLQPGAVVCVKCGTNTQSGRKLSTKRLKAPAIGGGGRVWPTVIGIIAMVLGGFTILAGVVIVVAGLAVGGPATMVAMVTAAIVLAFGLWEFSGGLDTLRRRQAGPGKLRWFAAVSLVLIVIGALLQAYAANAGIGASARFDPETGQPPLSPGAGVAAALISGMLQSIWPLFLLWWTSRGKVQADVGSWRG